MGAVSKFCAQPTEAHLTAVKRVLRYLSGTKELALRYRKSEEPPIGYSDADWAGDHDDRHSTSGNLFMFGGGAICWSSKKQAVVALSTSEAEYIHCNKTQISCNYFTAGHVKEIHESNFRHIFLEGNTSCNPE